MLKIFIYLTSFLPAILVGFQEMPAGVGCLDKGISWKKEG